MAGFFDLLGGGQSNKQMDAATTAATGLTAQTQQQNANALYAGANNAAGALNTGAQGALSSLIDAYTKGAGALTNYGGQAQTALANGVNNAVGTVQGSNAMFQPYAANGAGANAMIANALGLNGAGGNAAATAAFQAAPGYQYQVDQATDAAARKAASLGMAASGNTLSAITQLGSNLANQQWGSWLDRLSGQQSTGLSAANAMSGNNAMAGQFQYGGGSGLANLLQGLGTSLNTNATGLGTAQANVQNGLGTNLANISTNLGNALTSNAWTGANAINGANLQDAASSQAIDNQHNGILSQLIGGVGGSLLGSTASGKALGGLLGKL